MTLSTSGKKTKLETGKKALTRLRDHFFHRLTLGPAHGDVRAVELVTEVGGRVAGVSRAGHGSTGRGLTGLSARPPAW